MKQNENTKYVKLGITGAAVLAFGFAIMYILNQSKNIAAGIQLVFNILKTFPVWCVDCLSAGTDL